MEHRQKRTIHVFCDNFPELKIDSITTDTIGLKKIVGDELNEYKTDSIKFIIECPDNIVLASVTLTENILKKQVSLYQGNRVIVTIYNKCSSEFSFPSDKRNRKPADIVIIVDNNGVLTMDNKSTTIDSICEKYRGQNISIEIIADNKLSLDKFSEIFIRLEKEGFKVLLGH